MVNFNFHHLVSDDNSFDFPVTKRQLVFNKRKEFSTPANPSDTAVFPDNCEVQQDRLTNR